MNPDIYKLRDRLWIDLDEMLSDLFRRFKEDTIPQTYSHMEKHFRVAKEKPAAFLNHGQVLALSFGGSNTKIMLASMVNGQIKIDYVIAQENPEKTVTFYEYLDQFMMNDPVIRAYLDQTDCPEIGVSIPMMIIEDCPYHVNKIPTIDKLVARSKAEFSEELQFSKNFDRYMKSRGFDRYRLFYQSDGIVAHHGAVSVTDVRPEDKTVLSIVGTGMANGDELHYQPMAMINTLPADEDLYPSELTENHQLQYAIAGKGLWVILRSLILTWNQNEASLLRGKKLEDFFRSNADSRYVCKLYAYKCDASKIDDDLKPLLQAAGEGADELLCLAEFVAVQVYKITARMIYATQCEMGPLSGDGRYVVYLEGSIARNPVIKEHLFTELRELYKAFPGKELIEDPDLKPYMKGENCTEEMLHFVDTTLVGTASMIMAECVDD